MSALRKNVASQVVTFCLVNATTGAALTGATVTTKVALDGTQSAGAGTVTELGTGQYKYVPTQAETNGASVGFCFTATNAVPVNLHCFTTSQDPTIAQTGDAYARLGAAGAGLTALGDTRIANLDAAVSTRLATAGYTAPPTAAANATQVRSELTTELAQITLAKKILKNRTQTNPSTGIMTVYDDDGTTPLLTANIYEDVAGTVPYDGSSGVNRRNALS